MSFPFQSRRSSVVCSNGCVACSQPLASQIGIDILKAGGNAADAAVAIAAALNVTEPCSTGIGGDVFCLFYDAKSKTVKGLNGSGRAPANLSLEKLNQQGFNKNNPIPISHGHSVTVPGAAAAWADTVKIFGSQKLSLSQILNPAIELAETGFPVQEITARQWEMGSHFLQEEANVYGRDMLLNGKAPRYGEVMRLPHLANTLKELGTHGKDMFYGGRIAKAISDVIHQHGGVLNVEDLQSHVTTYEQPISTDYKGVRLWEIPPNGQGITALMTLNIFKQFADDGVDIQALGLNSVKYLHILIEAIKLIFADTTWFCADPSKVSVPVEQLLSQDYAEKRKNLIRPDRVLQNTGRGDVLIGNDTVYFTTADRHGNACSFINSNFMGFGTGIIPEGCGFTLQNRGCGFSLDPDHPNVIAPNKRPYHTIIPAMVTANDDLIMSYGVMGGFMQPQGHVQVLLNMIEFGLDPQQALDQSRICVGGGYGFDGSFVSVEEGISADVIQGLKELGHKIEGPVSGIDRIKFGRGQVISKGPFFMQNSRSKTERNTYWAGTDPRADGLAIGY